MHRSLGRLGWSAYKKNENLTEADRGRGRADLYLSPAVEVEGHADAGGVSEKYDVCS